MAAACLPRPGTEYGPCPECSHTDCELTRKMASALCPICLKPIGYDCRFIRDDQDRLCHEICEILRLERKRASRI